jgi:hypothetical protein
MKPTSGWTAVSPYDRFNFFLAPKADRYKALLLTVEKLKLNSIVITVEGNRHIFIFPQGKKSKRPAENALPFMGESPYMLVAHYDRVEGSPGANDNSIAVFHLLRAAILLEQKKLENWIIVFTDKEELVSGESFETQGSFTLAQKFKSWGLEKVKIYNFDACGSGDTFVFSNIADTILGNNESPNIIKVNNEIQQLKRHALETARHLRIEKVLMAPLPFCDDMGFLRAGFAAQTVTMLPSDEASRFEEVLRNHPEFTNLLISGGMKNSGARDLLPATWKNLNSPEDTPDRLTPEHFDQITRFIVELCIK